MFVAGRPNLNALVVAVILPLMAGAFTPSQKVTVRFPSSLSFSYLDSLSSPQAAATNTSHAPSSNFSSPPSTSATSITTTTSSNLIHAPLNYFSLPNLSSKGPRATFDWGTPQDWSRKLCDDGTFRAGSWYCSQGGWPSPNGKAVTEVFYVLDGHGMLGDSDGAKHYFGPGDVVIIPKGHTGRWDVNMPIHKVWAVNAHDRVEESGPVVRVRVDHSMNFARQFLMETSGKDILYGSNTGGVASASKTFYDVGPTKVGVWTCEAGSFYVASGTRQWFHVVEGVIFITDEIEGISKRCVPGDTVVLSAGWSGYVDVVEPVKKIFTVAE
mmetsp:Transcript_6334/g.13748  ORF Transcript_6334/g.13748 Transcript_6334/m.13748 type:complete len:326 (+) Transcript_6334:13-990(+)